jgi:hypothetical protein
MRPRVAARLKAGAVEAVPITTLDKSPMAPDFSPFSTLPPGDSEAAAWFIK